MTRRSGSGALGGVDYEAVVRSAEITDAQAMPHTMTESWRA
jgi:hypothetical protein